MFGIDDAIVAAVGGSVVSGLFNSASASDNRYFQAKQRSTAYQTAVEDLKKAGLNPMLAYGNGPAPTPSGSTAAPVSFGDMGYSSAKDAKVKTETAKLLEEQQKTEQEKQRQARAEAAAKESEVALNQIRGNQMYQQIDKEQLNIDALQQQVPYASANAAADHLARLATLKKMEQETNHIIQEAATGKATEEHIRKLIEMIDLEMPALKNASAYAKLKSGNPSLAIEAAKELGGIVKDFLPKVIIKGKN